jgi:hypothetical protein
MPPEISLKIKVMALVRSSRDSRKLVAGCPAALVRQAAEKSRRSGERGKI